MFTAFLVSGAIGGLAGVLYAAQYGTIDSTAGVGYELQVIAAVVVGGVAIFGGSGSVVGAALGALLLQTILSALYVLGVSPFWNQAIAGALLLGAITLDRGISLWLAAALAQEEDAPWRPTSRAAGRGLVRVGVGAGARALVAVLDLRNAGVVAVPDELQHLLPQPVDRRDRDHDAPDDADHRHGRDRPLRRLDPRHVERAARRPVQPRLADVRS